jgi:hypothetical protein
VNLFVPATVRFTARGTAVTVVQRTTFPASDVVDFAVTAATPVAFALRVRQPQWLHEPITATVNGERIAVKPDAHGWLAIERTWQTGDGVALRVPVPLWSAPLPGGAQYPAAILAGPVVLAVRTTGRSPHGAIDLAHLAEVLEPSPGEELTFHVRGQPDLLLRPFHAVGADQPYFVYLDPALQNRVDHRDVAFRGGWHAGPRFHYSNAADAAAELAFDGTGIRWLGFAFDDAGIAEVTIDGNVVARVDQYGAGRDLPFDWRHTGLPKGRHVLRLRLTGERREASKDCYLNVAGFEIEPGQ